MRENNLRGQEHRFTYIADYHDLERLCEVDDFAIIRLDGWYRHTGRFIDKLIAFEERMMIRRKERGK